MVEREGRAERGAGTQERESDTGAGAVVRLRPLSVLIVSPDHSFRAVMAMLIARRGCSVLSLASAEHVGDLLARERIDVALVDGWEALGELAEEIARAIPLAAPVGVVLVAGRADPVPRQLVAVAKWSPIERVFAAIVRADRRRTRPRACDCPPGPSPVAAAVEL